MTTILTIFSLLAALIFFILGMMLIIAGKDNYAKIVIGIISSTLSAIVFAGISTSLPHIVDGSINAMPVLILQSRTLTILLTLTTLLSIFPILALNPDWTKKKTISVILIPIIVYGLIYFPFSINLINETHLTSLHTFSGNIALVTEHLSIPDVFVRFLLLIFIFFIPFAIHATTSIVHLSHKNRKPTINYTIYYIALAILAIVIMAYCIDIPYSGLTIAVTLSSFVTILLVGYYRNSSYLTTFVSSPSVIETDLLETSKQNPKANLSSVDTSFLDIWVTLDELTKVDNRFTNPDLQVQEIADEMRINKNIINDTLHRKGFNSYKEYLNSLRLIRFKELADKDPSAEITSLYEQAGFSSKSTFYRIFNISEGITPSEYMNKLCKFHTM